MQEMYEIILDRKLDKRNFQKKIFSIGVIKDTGEKDRSTNRPAKLYQFINKRVRVVDML